MENRRSGPAPPASYDHGAKSGNRFLELRLEGAAFPIPATEAALFVLAPDLGGGVSICQPLSIHSGNPTIRTDGVRSWTGT